MNKEFNQIQWDDCLEDDCRQIVRLAVREDLDRLHDWTTVGLASADARGTADIVARGPGVIAGLRACEVALDEMEIQDCWRGILDDGDPVQAGAKVATLVGSIRDLLTAERLLLNLIGRLSGIATLTSRYVEAVHGTKARIYDTRKTTPGWRRLEKYAVRCGGGRNHRTGLFDAVLIKDNHLALGGLTADQAVQKSRDFLQKMLPVEEAKAMILEIEVDTLQQLEQVLPTNPDIVLLDNMTPKQLSQAVAMRDSGGVHVELEASGGVNLDTVRGIAESGVERVSVGALTHSAVGLDVGLDWPGLTP